MYTKQILASGFTRKRFLIQLALILLINGILSASMIISGWDLEFLVIIGIFAGTGLSSSASVILSRSNQFWALGVLSILVGLIPFIILKSYCYFSIENAVCSARLITGNSFAFWIFPSLIMWIPWILAPLDKARRGYG